MCDCGSNCTLLSFSRDSFVSTLKKTRHISLIVHICGQICAVLVIQMLWCCLQTIEEVSVKVLLPPGLGFMRAAGQIVFYRFCESLRDVRHMCGCCILRNPLLIWWINRIDNSNQRLLISPFMRFIPNVMITFLMITFLMLYYQRGLWSVCNFACSGIPSSSSDRRRIDQTKMTECVFIWCTNVPSRLSQMFAVNEGSILITYCI